MSSTMVVTPYAAAPGRACGALHLCCKVYALPELEKPPGVWCRHCTPGKGCAIHDFRARSSAGSSSACG